MGVMLMVGWCDLVVVVFWVIVVVCDVVFSCVIDEVWVMVG